MNSAKPFTVHSSRTIMFAELAQVMDYAVVHDNRFLQALRENIINKRTRVNQEKTERLLVKLYGFDQEEPAFKCFKYFWARAEAAEKSVLALLFCIGRDYLLGESISVVLSTPIGEKVSTEKLEANVEALHPKQFSDNTCGSIARNIVSSWKQAGYISGKVKSIRTQTKPGYLAVTFALLLSYLNGGRGDFIMKSKWVKALGIGEEQVRELAFEAAKRDLLQYQFAGTVTTITFSNLLTKLGIHGI